MNLNLRPYQVNAVLDAVNRLKGEDVLLQAPTGSGKTIMGVAIADAFLQWDRRVIFYAPRRELIDQTADKFESFGYSHGTDYGIIMAGEDLTYKTLNCPIQIASKDTVHTRMRNGKLGLPEADLVIADEAHLSLSPTWVKLLEAHEETGASILGLTATPARGDGRGLGAVYDSMIECPTVQELTTMGYLSPAKYYAPTTVDLEGVETDYKKHDFKEGQIQERMSQPTIVGDIVTHWLKLAGGRRTVVFCAGVKHSILVRDRFKAHGITAGHVDGSTPTNERNEIFNRFRSGKTQVLCNCMVATYGFDLPEMDCVVLARPTKSIVLHLQMLGRGLRVAEGKDHCLVIDHAGNVNRMGFASDPVPWDLADSSNVYEQIKSSSPKEKSAGIICEACSAVYKGQRECPECGWQPPQKRGRNINVVDGELREVGNSEATEAEILDFYLRMKGLLLMNQKNPNRAYHLTKEKFGYKPPWKWNEYAPRPANDRVRSYLKYSNIRYAKSRRRAG